MGEKFKLAIVGAGGIANAHVAAAQDAPSDSADQSANDLAAAVASPLPEGPVYVVRISGMIDKGLALYVDRAVADAEAAGSSAIIFHIDTFTVYCVSGAVCAASYSVVTTHRITGHVAIAHH